MSPKKPPTKPVDIYVRVSVVGGRDVEAEHGTADVQEKRCRAALESKGLPVGKVHTDLDHSGGKASRPAFDRAVARIESGTSGGIVALNLSRFGRHGRVEEQILNLEALGGTVILVEDSIDTSTASGRLLLGFLARLNQYYLEMVAETWQGVHARRRAAGKAHSLPLGYARGADGRLVPNGHADAVREVFEARAGGKSWSECAAILTASGATTKAGKKGGRSVWSIPATRGVVRNRAYLGEVGGEPAHPEIVEADVFARANRSTARKVTRGTGEGRLLARIAKCGTCSGGLSYESTTLGGKKYEYLRCKASPECTGRATIPVPAVEEFVVEHALAHLGAFHWKRGESTEDIAAAESALQRARRDLAEIEDALGTTAPATSRQALALADAEAALEAAFASTGTPAESLIALAEDPTGTGLRHRFDRLSIPDKRDVLRGILERVDVRAGRGSALERVTLTARNGRPVKPAAGPVEDVREVLAAEYPKEEGSCETTTPSTTATLTWAARTTGS